MRKTYAVRPVYCDLTPEQKRLVQRLLEEIDAVREKSQRPSTPPPSMGDEGPPPRPMLDEPML